MSTKREYLVILRSKDDKTFSVVSDKAFVSSEGFLEFHDVDGDGYSIVAAVSPGDWRYFTTLRFCREDSLDQ